MAIGVTLILDLVHNKRICRFLNRPKRSLKKVENVSKNRFAVRRPTNESHKEKRMQTASSLNKVIICKMPKWWRVLFVQRHKTLPKVETEDGIRERRKRSQLSFQLHVSDVDVHNQRLRNKFKHPTCLTSQKLWQHSQIALLMEGKRREMFRFRKENHEDISDC